MTVIATSLDWVLDWTIVPGFTSIGYRLRGLDDAPADPRARLRGSTVVVTGASSGIGVAAASRFAELGARVHMVVRDLDKGGDVRAAISEQTGSDELYLHRCDISSLDSVRELAVELGELDGIDALVHNAGVMTKERSRSADGFELTLATHVLGPLLLTELLAPALERHAPSKVVFVTSGGMYAEHLDADDVELTKRDFRGSAFYAHAKRIQTILAGQLDRRLGARGISVHAMHPGWADTPGVVDSLPLFHRLTGPVLRTPEQAADTIVWLAASAEAERRSGRLWMDRRVRPAHRVPWTRESATERARLWERLTEMISLNAVETDSGVAAGG
jgi:dehydrogenase/reductase SDR family protein 12